MQRIAWNSDVLENRSRPTGIVVSESRNRWAKMGTFFLGGGGKPIRYGECGERPNREKTFQEFRKQDSLSQQVNHELVFRPKNKLDQADALDLVVNIVFCRKMRDLLYSSKHDCYSPAILRMTQFTDQFC